MKFRWALRLVAFSAAASFSVAVQAAPASTPPTVDEVMAFERENWSLFADAAGIPAGAAPLEVRRLRCRTHAAWDDGVFLCKYRLAYGPEGEAAGRRWLSRGACELGVPGARGEDGRWHFDLAIMAATPRGTCADRLNRPPPFPSRS